MSRTGEVLFYFMPLTLLVGLILPHGIFVDIATAYILKNDLHASASQISSFRLLTAIPVYLSVVFGFARDLWNPLGMRDRGYFLVFGAATAAVFVLLTLFPLSYAGLFAGIFLTMVTFRFLTAAYQGLMALVGQEQLMSGRLSALWQTGNSAASLIAGVGAGYVTEHFSFNQTFFVMAALALMIAALAYWKPRAVFAHAYDRPLAQGADLVSDIKRLAKHRAVYPPIIIMLLFSFSPGLNTPMQFYLSDTVHASDAVYGEFNGLFVASLIPMYFVYGYLCKRVSLEKLLWLGAVIAVPQLLPLVFINSGEQALIMAVPMGLMGGIVSCAIYDLTMRSCPPGMQGTLMMLVDGVFLLSMRASDVLGSAIYDADPKNGFVYCAIVTTIVYAAILPVLLIIPKDVIATRDGEANPELEAEILAEIAETKAPA